MRLSRLDKRPFEYQLLGEDPRPFTTQDVYCATGFMAYSFAIHLKTEPILDWMKHNLGQVYWDDLALGQDGFTRIPLRIDSTRGSGMLPDCHRELRDWMSFDLCLSGWGPTLG